jgi:hypothetical protein
VGVVRRIKSQGRTTRQLPVGQATANWPAPTDVKPRRRIWTRVLAVLALIAAIAAGVVIAIDPGGSSSPEKPKPQRPAAPAAVPRSDDPATQARQLGDFLRDQARPASPNTQQP